RFGTTRLRHGNCGAIAFSPDGKKLISFGKDRAIRIWDPVTGTLFEERLLPSEGHTPILMLSSDGTLAAFWDAQSPPVFCLWDGEQHKLRHQFSVGDDTLVYARTYAAFSPDSKTLVRASARSGDIHAYDVVTGKDRLVGRQKKGAEPMGFSTD